MATEEADDVSKKTPRRTSSKYDFVKVKVWLGENSDHYYVLSRFLVSRMLTVTKISNVAAIKIALELKKLLVDANLLDVSQADLEANLFKLMQKRGYGEEYISRYKMMTSFHHQRVPLLVLIGGTACVGKSTIATQLAQRLNLPNVLQTDIIYELLRTDPNNAAPLNATPLWARTDLTTTEDLMQEFRRECRVIRKGVDGDLTKTMSDGKPLIMEGLHLDPGIYLTELPQARVGKPTPSKSRKVHPSEMLHEQARRVHPDDVIVSSEESGAENGVRLQAGSLSGAGGGWLADKSNQRVLTSASGKQRSQEIVGQCRSVNKVAGTSEGKQKKSKGKLKTGSLAEAKNFLRSLARTRSGEKVRTPSGGVKMSKSASSCHVAGEFDPSPLERAALMTSVVSQRSPGNRMEADTAQRDALRKGTKLAPEKDRGNGHLIGERLRILRPDRIGTKDCGPQSPRGEQHVGLEASPLATGSTVSGGSEERRNGRTDAPREESPGILLSSAAPLSILPETDGDRERNGNQGNGHERNENGANGTDKNESQREEPIIVQIVLRMGEKDHRALLEEWLASRSGDVEDDVKLDKTVVLQRLRTIQDYLCSFEDQGVAVFDVSTTSFAQTLDGLHSYLLECIESSCFEAEG